MFMVILALIALALYIFAPQIIAAVPESEAVLTPYVDWVDGLRIGLDQKIQAFIEQSGEAEAPATDS